MTSRSIIKPPFNFNPLKHHLGYVSQFIRNQPTSTKTTRIPPILIPLLKRIGSSVTDLYTGDLPVGEIVGQINNLIDKKIISSKENYAEWMNEGREKERALFLSDGSEWILKFIADSEEYIHFFPARGSVFSIRTKGNTLKSAIAFLMLLPDPEISLPAINKARDEIDLSPLRSARESGTIVKIIELLETYNDSEPV